MDKVYTPEVIQETPFPGDLASFIQDSVSSNITGGNYKPATTNQKKFPTKRIATELLSAALNTRSKRILDEFELQDSGGFKIGNFKEGISGDLRFTPNGLTARNKSGLTTFAVDGQTGDAVFKGTVQAADFIVIDEFGLKSLATFQSDYYTADDTITTSSGSYVDISGSSLSFELSRDTNVFIFFDAFVQLYGTTNNVEYRTEVAVNIDGTDELNDLYATTSWFQGTAISFIKGDNVSAGRIVTLGAGSHTIKLRWRTSGNPQSDMGPRSLNYLILGA